MRRTPIHVTLVLAAMAAALTGCSQLPTAPRPETLAPAVVSPESAPVVISQTDDPHPPGELGRSGLDTITLDVGQSGAVRAGRFTLFIHKNSLKQPATIVMSQPDPNVMQVEFTVTPADANDFQVPVKLVADCSNVGRRGQEDGHQRRRHDHGHLQGAHERQGRRQGRLQHDVQLIVLHPQ
jgi:hypothetical protein